MIRARRPNPESRTAELEKGIQRQTEGGIPEPMILRKIRVHPEWGLKLKNAVPSLRFLAWKVLHFCLLPYLCGMDAARGIT